MKFKRLPTIMAICIFTILAAQAQTPQQRGQRAEQRPTENPLLTSIKTDLNRVFDFLNANTPPWLIDRETQAPVTDYKKINAGTVLEQGRFGLLTYEWGVTYSSMLRAADILEDKRYTDYVYERFNFIGDIYPYFVKVNNETGKSALRGLIAPIWLDDCGSMQAAFVKGILANPALASKLRPIIDCTFDFTMNKEHRLPDRTLARLRPTVNSLWVDDMYMGIPPIAYMGKLVEKEDSVLAKKYYNEAALQIELFKKYLWVPEMKLFKHSWVESMTYHPSLFWGRANGWALLCMSDVLDILPPDHIKRPEIMALLLEQIHGFMALQGGDGFFHQLLDRNDSYTETSATAIFAYVIAHAVNEGWVDIQAYGPSAVAAWKAVSTRINELGEVEGTCVGTGVAYEPGFYYRRPTNVNAAHGYGPVILAGSEVLKMMRTAPRFY
ncbi:MAG: glycoside hydrolase family 88 protein [Tannerella sp.]|jgi:rhamnogalacturonyl hydrolase YesR|nr:glycoside hydrolase family 88 protein [Tannerella sp.]